MKVSVWDQICTVLFSAVDDGPPEGRLAQIWNVMHDTVTSIGEPREQGTANYSLPNAGASVAQQEGGQPTLEVL